MSDGQEFSEDVRKDSQKNLRRYSKAVDARKLARTVDQQALEKCMVHKYAQYRNNLARTIGEEMDDIEKARGRYGGGFHRAEIPLNISFEQIYYDNIGKGINGTEAPSRIGEEYICPGCGLRFQTSMKLAPLECPICKRLTPLGQLMKANPSWYKRI